MCKRRFLYIDIDILGQLSAFLRTRTLGRTAPKKYWQSLFWLPPQSGLCFHLLVGLFVSIGFRKSSQPIYTKFRGKMARASEEEPIIYFNGYPVHVTLLLGFGSGYGYGWRSTSHPTEISYGEGRVIPLNTGHVLPTHPALVAWPLGFNWGIYCVYWVPF